MANDTAPQGEIGPAGESAAESESASPNHSSSNGAAPASSRKPDAIAREIELTRAELADTIDAIADRVNPKRAVSRGTQAVRAQMASSEHSVGGIDPRLLALGAALGAILALLIVRRKRS
jgi:hypothetical protein